MATTMSIPSIDDPINLAGPSKAPSPPVCALCSSQPSKYTCPRCQTKTCSLTCSRTHKTTTGCSGERDRTAFVPMNQYGYGALVNDYVFLEEVGRKVENWGRDIVRDGIPARPHSGAALRGSSTRGGRGRGRGMNRTFGHGKDKKSFLAMQLSFRDIDMDILPFGMDRAQKNTSSWDAKGKRALFTVELIFLPPPDPLTRRETRSASIITNKNDWDQTIRQIIQTSIGNSKRTRNHEALLHWLSLEDEDESIPSSVLCLMKRPRAHDDLLDMNSAHPSFYKLDWNAKLSKALRYKHFVEFPTILLIDENSFDGVLVDDKGAAEDVRERRPKRRKLDVAEARKTISSLVGEYGSDDEEEELNVLDTLADYSGSEGDAEDVHEPGDDKLLDEAREEETGEFQDAFDAEQIPDEVVAMDDDDDVLDWGNDEIAEDEAKLASLSAAIQQRYSS